MDDLVSAEQELRRHAPQPYERVFYWGSGSPQAWRVLIALEEKGIPYRSVCVSFSSGVLKSPFFRALNPRMRVPVLVEPMGDDTTVLPEAAPATSPPPSGGASSPLDVNWLLHSQQPRTVLYESAAILAYLERRYPSVACLPRDVRSFAVAQTRMHEANEILSVVGDLVVYLRRFPAEARNAAVLQAKWAALEHELAIWEQYLDGRAFLVSMDTPYLCDYTLFTNVAYAVRCGLQLDGLYPRLAMFYVRLCARASVEKTWPPHWKTTFGTKVLTKCFSCSGAAPCACCRPQEPVGNTNAPPHRTMGERRISLTVVPEAATLAGQATHERKPPLSSGSPRKHSLTSATLLAAGAHTMAHTPTRKHSLSSAAMVAAIAVGGGSAVAGPPTRTPSLTATMLAATAVGFTAAAAPTRKHSLTAAAMVAAVAVSGNSTASNSSSPREHKHSLTSVGNSAAAAGLVSSRKPSMASVGIAAAVAIGASSRTLLAATPQGTPAAGAHFTGGGTLARAPSARHMSTLLSSSSSSPGAALLKKQQHHQPQQQQLLSMKATRRSFSSSYAALDAQRLELFFHVPTHKELQRLRVHRTLTLIGLQALVQREFGIPFEDQRLYWHGDLLEGDEDLAFYDIHDQSVLNLRVRKRYRPIGDVFTKVKTVQFRPSTTNDYEIVEVVAPLPPTHVLFKRLVAAITYLQRLDFLQAQRTQHRVWKQRVAFWEEPTAYPTNTITSGRRRSSLAPLPVQLKSTRSRSTTSSNGDPRETDAMTAPIPVPPGFVKLHSGPERVSYVVSLAHTHGIAHRLQLAADQRAPSDLRHIKKWLSSIKFFASASLPDAAMHEIARACTYERFRAGDFLFRQGDIGDHFYILISGCVSLAAYGNGFFATMTPGACFGEISLFAGNNGLRTASANVNFAAPYAELALLSGDIYRRVINPYKKAVLQTTEKAIYSVPQLRSLPDHIVTHIAYASKKLEAKGGRLLVHRGEEMNVLVLLIKGEVKVSATAQPSSSWSPNQPPNASPFPVVSVVRSPAVFCQEAVLANMPSPAPWDIEALDPCTLLCLRTDTISIFLAPRPDIIRALNREHTQRLQDFEQRFAQYAPAPPTPKDDASSEKADTAYRRRSACKLSRKVSYMRLLSSRIFESQRSLLSGAEHRSRGRRGAAAHVQFPKILLREPTGSGDQRDEDNTSGQLVLRGDSNTDAPDGKPSRPLTSPAASPSCADLQDEYLHRTLPFSEILDLREQIQFCSFAAQDLEEQDTRGRTRALLRGLRQQPVEEVEMVPTGDEDGIHFRFTPRPPTSPTSSSPLVALHTQRQNLQTR